MAILKCKMCGGDLTIEEGVSVCECEYCGTKQTAPIADDEKKLNLFNRATRLRINGEFDKAAALYESLVAEFPEEAEAYWGLVICHYGIEYVDDPATGNKVPTCHRASFDPISGNDNFRMAMEYADVLAQKVYRDEAREIDRIREEILSVCKDEKPYDIFICYKETDAQGERTIDSVIAQDVYDALTDKGYRVFFARISLEDKLGSQYEPFIFSALNSARIMLAFGTKYEYFHAVWVKNEWSRFLKLMAKDKSKVLIPCYKDMDAYDMPDEFHALQAQDMGKIGAIQDLLRGVAKVLDAEKQAASAVVKETIVTGGGGNVAPLLKRAFMFLEDGDWESADEYCEKVLDIDPECGEAYLAKLMAELRIKMREDLKQCSMPFDQYNNYQKAMRFGDATLQDELKEYIDFITNRNLTAAYDVAVNAMKNSQTPQAYEEAATAFEQLGNFKDAAQLVEQCHVKSEETRKEIVYKKALLAMKSNAVVSLQEAAQSFQSISSWKDASQLAAACLEKAEELRKDEILTAGKEKMASRNISILKQAIQMFQSIPGWRDADDQVKICQENIAKLKEQTKLDQQREREAQQKLAIRRKKITLIVIAVICWIVAFVILVNTVIVPGSRYKKAVALMEKGSYTEAIAAFEELGGYKDSIAKIQKCKTKIQENNYNHAVALMEEDCYTEAIAAFDELDEYKDSAAKIQECWYLLAEDLVIEGNVAEAAMAFGKAGDFKDAKERSFKLWDEIAVREKISAGYRHNVGLKADGTVVAIGRDDEGQCNVLNWSNIVAVSAGQNYTVGLRADGVVVAVGGNYFDECDVSEWTNIIAISAGNYHTVGLKADGTVVAVGDDFYGQCDVSEWSNIVAISASNHHTVGLKADGTVVAVGNNSDGRCVVSSWTDIVAISAGANHTVGLKADGTVVAVGDNIWGQCNMSKWTDVVAISASSSHTVGVKSDGTVVAIGDASYDRCDVSSWSDIVAISAGSSHTIGLKENGMVVAVGYNGHKQCDVSDWDLS